MDISGIATTRRASWNSLRRNDLYQATGVTGFAVPAWLAHLGGDEAKMLFREAKGRYQPQSNFQWSDYLILVADLNIALYDGHPQDGVALAADQWSALEQSQLLRMRIASALMHYYRAGCAVSTMQRTRANSRSLGSMARSSAGALRKTDLTNALGWAAVISRSPFRATTGGRRGTLAIRRRQLRFDAAVLVFGRHASKAGSADRRRRRSCPLDCRGGRDARRRGSRYRRDDRNARSRLPDGVNLRFRC